MVQSKKEHIEFIEVDEIQGVTRESIDKLMSSVKIPRVSIASHSDVCSVAMSIAKSDTSLKKKSISISSSTEFNSASLSKPVFSYLVLKLIDVNLKDEFKLTIGKFKSPFMLKTLLYTVYRNENGKVLPDDMNPFLKRFKPEQWDYAKKLTAELILAHRSGLHIIGKEPYSFQFEPGRFYAYSGPGIDCLQAAIIELTGSDFNDLAWEFVFGHNALNLKNTSFGPEPNAANSLRTSSADYIQFLTAWMNDPKLNYAFKPVNPVFNMIHDYFSRSEDKLVEKITVDEESKTHVTWGLGIGLVINDKGEVIGAYHTGDMNEWRSGFGMEINPKSHHMLSATVYFSDSHNGHILAEKVLPRILNPALNYFFPTYGFARNADELEGTDFYGMNPKLLKPELREKAYQTRSATHYFKEQLQNNKKDDFLDKAPSP
jgi:hypothetical protein